MAIPLANAGGPYAALPYGSTSQALTGSGTPGTGGTSIVSYVWSIISQPPGASATLSSTTVQNPTINGMSIAGTYLMKLVVTDNLGAVSESVTTMVPPDGRAAVCVTTENLALQIPATYEFDWLDDKARGWAEALDSLSGDFIPATTATLGIVKLAEAPVDAANPKAVTQDRMMLTAFVKGKISVSPTSGAPAQTLVTLPVPEDCTAVDVTLSFMDGGTTGRTAYTIVVYHQTLVEFLNNTFSTTLATFTVGAPATSGKPIADYAPGFTQACTSRDFIAVKVTAADADAADQASDLVVVVTLRKKW